MTPPYLRRVSPEALTAWQREHGCPLMTFRWRRCRKPITHLAVRWHVRRKAGPLVVYTRQPLCPHHAKLFAAKNRIKLDGVRETPLA